MTARTAKRWIWPAGVAAVLAASAGHASTAGEGPAPLVDRSGALADLPPPSDDMARVVLRCTVRADRSVDHCTIASEFPRGHGLGDAALRMSDMIRVGAETFSPDMVGARVDIPINFERDPDANDMPSGVAAMPSP
jgi:hypothetical protein